MAIDTWNPDEEKLGTEEVDSIVDRIQPATREVQQRMDALVTRKKFLEQQGEQQKGKCNYCLRATTRDFCGRDCETKAAFATMGKALKIHE